MKPTIALVSAFTIALSSGCSLLPTVDFSPPPPVKVITEEVKVDIYQPPLPNEIGLENVEWFVITKNNWDESVAKVENLLGGDFVVMALTPKGYENMAYNLQEIRRYIRQQKEIILYYRKATEAADESDEWLEKNDELQSD
tara:strand:+ start:10 stop:432 length:423 start_codon:yes stop_codon:yes gene_type:complete